jgi:aspartyl protease family protein
MIGWALRHVMIWGGVAVAVLMAIGYGGDRFGVGERKGGGTVAAPAAQPVPRKAASRSMAIRAGQGGHFLVDASVDGVAVRFVVDTGATRVVLTPEDAKRVGLQVRDRHFTEKSYTAGGIVRVAPVTLRELRIGHLTVRDVEASVNEQPIGISLLGMTFLSRLDGYRVEGDKLILEW